MKTKHAKPRPGMNVTSGMGRTGESYLVAREKARQERERRAIRRRQQAAASHRARIAGQRIREGWGR